MYADVFDELWDAHVKRRTLDMLDLNRREMVMAMYANGNVGGDELKTVLGDIAENHESARRAVLLGENPADVSTTDEGFVSDTESAFFRAATKGTDG